MLERNPAKLKHTYTKSLGISPVEFQLSEGAAKGQLDFSLCSLSANGTRMKIFPFIFVTEICFSNSL